MERIGLLTALKFQVPSFILCKKTDEVQVYQIGHKEIGLLVSGIGQENASNAFFKLYQEFSPDYIILAGFCGGVNDSLNIGDLLIPKRAHYNGDKVDLSSSQLEKIIEFLSRSNIKYSIGDIQTFDNPVFSCQGVLETVVGVDMESYAVCKASQNYSSPLIILKSVSDVVQTTYRNPCFNPRENIRIAKTALDKFFQGYF